MSLDQKLKGKAELLLAMLTPIQKQYVLDKHRFKLARCTRRAGKTFAVAAYMIYECIQQKNVDVLYAGLTRDSAKKAVWSILVEMLDGLQIEYEAKESTLSIEFANGSTITLFGCDAQNARNRLRGRKFKLVCFDETAFYASLDPIVHAILPTLADWGGTLSLTSSPGELLVGLFYEADMGKEAPNWARYSWSMYDNPLFQQPALDPKYGCKADEELDIVCRLQFKGNRKAPGFRREYLGEWVEDSTTLVYPATDINRLLSLHKLPFQRYSIGIGLSAPYVNSLVVGTYSEYSREFQIIEANKYEDLEPDEFAAIVEEKAEAYDTDNVVAHIGDFTADVVDDFRKRYQIPVIGANDNNKRFHQKIFANDLKKGRIKILDGLPIWAEYGKIVKDSNGDEIKGQENFAADAALVLYRRVYNTVLKTVDPPLSEEDRHIHQLEQSRFHQETPWYEKDS